MTKRAYKERLYPTPEQAVLLAQSFGCVRLAWNNSLAYRTEAYQQHGESVSSSAAEKRLVDLKAEYPWLADVSSVILQQALRDQKAAFDNFFNPKLRARYPRFKRKDGRQSIRLTKAVFRYREGEITIAKSKVPLPIRWSRPLPSAPSSITISQDRAGRYFISCLCDFAPNALPITPKMAGIDLGLTDLFITSDGAKSGNPRHLKRYEAKLAYLQRQMAKKQKGSENRAKLRRKVATLHAKIADCRRDATHKATRTLINENQVLCVESLNIIGMVKNRSLAKAIGDAGWGEFVRQLEYKAAWASRQVVKVNQWFPSSKLCHGCGHKVEKLPLSQRHWHCDSCGQVIDRDINAAKNILTAGLAGLACGATGAGAAA
ncbi:IS200/IS605 family element transposase accessory protein TnpB [Halomonas sp. ZH2S]|uniref:IS200/IS605 family element transposase accessory protein TnpB n=1 Tax=Vreelandella zhuhanensis TaxID=2684210 RepID=A0A7X3KQB4_9GAMM|nr:RNA-guided endonuclease TnpB family protein [Halomonas zhuhanensis]MWJ28305.1 IS200/IS605 family element transposase accessory protein TnpB [Halomonas zhuhanensis]